jgi:hypothetical protein
MLCWCKRLHSTKEVLQILEKDINVYTRQHQDLPRQYAVKSVESIFERPLA